MIGGGIAGCLAASALVGRVERIVVVERDRYPDGAAFRPGTPQGRHAHLLLESGRRALQQLIPGLDAELAAAGAVRVPVPTGLRWLSSGGWFPRYTSELTITCCTRPLLDAAVRRRAEAEESVEFRQGTEVVGLLGGRSGITGVTVRERGGAGGPVEEIRADLVVDASGRTSATGKWLRELGCPETAEESVDAGVAYSTRFYRRPPGTDAPRSVVYIQTQAPDHPRLGVLLPVERDRWIVSVGGMRGAEPAPGEEGFAAQLDRLRDPLLNEVLAEAEPEGEVRGFRAGPSVRRHYEQGAPAGLVVLGDAACTFNPVYGQGMSIAALGALVLRDTVREFGADPSVTRRVQRGVATVAKNAWMMSSAEDVRFSSTVGGPSGSLIRLQHRYLDRVIAQSCRDESVCSAFVDVMSLLAPPASLFHPRVVWPVLRGQG